MPSVLSFVRLFALATGVGHSGSDGVFFSYFCFYPQQKAFFYFVGNSGEDPVVAQLKAVLKMLEDALGVGAAAGP